MRTKVALTLLAGMLSAGAAAAQDAVILLPSAEVRSGPSDKFYPTSKLLKGDHVTVLREAKDAQGWLEIKPPTGSFSWIKAKYVQKHPSRPAPGQDRHGDFGVTRQLPRRSSAQSGERESDAGNHHRDRGPGKCGPGRDLAAH